MTTSYLPGPAASAAPEILMPETSAAPSPADLEAREAFDQFVGTIFYGQLLKSMRSTVGKPAYFHGGRAEEVFGQQLDGVLAEQMTRNNAASMTDAMYELFTAAGQYR